MNTTIKIPTLLGLGILIFGLAIGVFLVAQNQNLLSKAGATQSPKNIIVTNLGPNSATIIWQTDQITTGFIQSGLTASLGFTFKDERDQISPEKHFLHSVPLTGLTPDTTYYYKINSGSIVFPKNEPSTFKTTSTLGTLPASPLIGKIVNSSLKPVEEALITLYIPEAQSIAAITKTGGNFILPLANLKTSSLDKGFDLQIARPTATLTVTGESVSSKVTLKLPLLNPILPPIVLGKDLEISQKSASPSGIPVSSTNQNANKFDLNKDGVVNALDYAMIVDNLGKRFKNNLADLNSDRVVDQKDLDLMTKFLNHSLP